ncbi:EamA/RhaT family transporter [Acuticoccus sediminis]|uniref:EamA/RhaT family transporter n=2 Tax=Acuticoccus sediminis TaxID=2184697 RepID=A0A8B2NH83_9HYPH|nr:DMT family transporter [Acuticoccus sediminis]RAH98841.1 EamA/RhaT family transporter [Acuticoccus sediminis]
MALFAAAMLIIPAIDACGKVLSTQISPFEVGLFRNLIQTGILFVALPLMGRAIFTPEVRAYLGRIALCGMFLSVCGGFMFWGLQTLPLANAIAIFFAEPLILTIFSVLFLGEKVGRHRTIAVLVGLLGALVVIRPNFAAFGWAALMPLASATLFAGAMTILRSLSGRVDAMRIQAMAGVFGSLTLSVLLIVGGIYSVGILEFTTPTAELWVLVLAVGLGATLVQLMMTVALRMAEASMLASFQYLEIVSATAIGYLVFGEFPDPLTWLGTAIILGAGLYVVHRERRRAVELRLAARRYGVGAPQPPELTTEPMP